MIRDLEGKVVGVSGGCGFIGSHVVEELINRGASVRIIDTLLKGNLLPLEIRDKCKHYFDYDIENYDDVDNFMYDCDYIIHLGALISVPDSFQRPMMYFATNVKGTQNILNCAKNHRIKRVIIASSCAVEFMSSPYAYTKSINEQQAKVYNEIYGMEIKALRFYNVYGSRQKIEGEGAVIPSFITQLLNNQIPTIYGNGNQMRDFVYVKDVAKLCVNSLIKPDIDLFPDEVGSGTATTINYLYKLISEFLKVSVKPFYAKKRVGDIQYSCAEYSELINGGEFTPLKEGLQKTIEWFKNNKK